MLIKNLVIITIVLFFTGCKHSGGNEDPGEKAIPEQKAVYVADCSKIDKRNILLPDPNPEKSDFKMRVTNNYELIRDGDINSRVSFRVAINGKVVIGFNGKGTLNYYYWNTDVNLYKNFSAWLERDGKKVSNTVEYIPTNLDENYQIKLEDSLKVKLVDNFGDHLFWVLDKEGTTVERKPVKEGNYELPELWPGTRHRAWIEKRIPSSEPVIVSNIVEIEKDEPCDYPYSLSLNEFTYEISRNGGSEMSLGWVIQKDGEEVLVRSARDEFKYTYIGNQSGSYYRIWLESFGDGRYVKVSNTLEYKVP
ncbi:MAG: hypothetical protein OEZ47_15020 [Gammaproteobacteria bacterium]|nr:hypothetical protein [Gammaproteobacteria bacterium]